MTPGSDPAAGGSDADAQRSVVIVGAGLAGLSAARVVRDAGHEVTLIDKSRGVGGRMATRRIGDAVFDHGAQFFTVRSVEFAAVVDRAIAASVVDVWCHGFGAHDGYPRYCGRHGMTSLAKHLRDELVADGVEFVLGEHIDEVRRSPNGYTVGSRGAAKDADGVIVTAPAPQALTMLEAGDISLDRGLQDELEQIDWKRAFALMAVLDGPSAMAAPGGDQRTEDDLFTFVADNSIKGISPVPALTFHTSGAFALARWEDDRDAITAELLTEALPWIGDANVVDAQLHAWKFAAPRPALSRTYAMGSDSNHPPLVLAGEAFGGPKVEGAFRSGLAAGQALIDHL